MYKYSLKPNAGCGLDVVYIFLYEYQVSQILRLTNFVLTISQEELIFSWKLVENWKARNPNY